MIPSSRLAGLSAVVAAVGLHGLALIDDPGSETTQIAGGGAVAVAALGNSFADMVSGTASPSRPTETKTVLPKATDRVTPDQAQQSEPAEMSSKPPPVSVDGAEPVEQKTISPSVTPAQSTDQPMPPISAETPDQTLQAPLSAAVGPAQVDSATRAPLETTTPSVVETAQNPKPKTLKPVPEPAPTVPPATARASGNSDRSARKGSETGTKATGAAQSATTRKRSTAQGNAASSNYAGIVFRKISRAKRQKVKIKGATRVSFRIAGNGGLAGLAVARSSGSQKLDQIALDQIRRAAPFPAPPAGARTSFSVEIRGR